MVNEVVLAFPEKACVHSTFEFWRDSAALFPHVPDIQPVEEIPEELDKDIDKENDNHVWYNSAFVICIQHLR